MLAPGWDRGLSAKIRALVENEYRVRGPKVGIALTSVEVVKQMILDSPLARVPDTAQPLNTVVVSIRLPYLRRLIEAVDAL